MASGLWVQYKAANKTKTELGISAWVPNLIQDSTLPLPPPMPQTVEPDYLELCWDKKIYTFKFFSNKSGMYIALCCTTGYEQIFGKDTSWWGAAKLCMDMIMKDKT
jgi:hypothetical protein